MTTALCGPSSLTDFPSALMLLQGWLLTRQWREHADGLTLIYWIHTSQGARKLVLRRQEAVCFVSASEIPTLQLLWSSRLGWRHRSVALKSFTNQPVHALYFQSQRQLQQCRDWCEQQGIVLWEADVRTVDRYLSERFICGDLVACLEADGDGNHESHDEVVTRLVKAEPASLVLHCVSLDIETAMNGSQLYSIAVYLFAASDEAHTQQEVIEQRIFMLGADEALNSDIPVEFIESEPLLLRRFLRWMQAADPDVLIGWNVINFDLRFLQQRSDALNIPLTLGRDNEVAEWRQARDEQEHYFILLPGRVVLDGIDTLKAATWSFESFSLEFVSQHLLQRGKLIHDVDNRGTAIDELFRDDKIALARYNLEDCRLVADIFQKADLLGFAIARSRLTGLPMDKVGGSVAAFENLYLPRLHRAGYVAPNLGEIQSDISAPGGYVMQSMPGLFEHVLVLDFKSLYPSIIRTFSIDPLSLIRGRFQGPEQEFVPDIFQRDARLPDIPESEWIPGFNGALFSKQQHLLPQIIETLWQARDEAKRHQNAPLSQAIKIIMNSFYGVLGTPLCRFFDPLLSSSITLRGHDIMRQTRSLIEGQGHKVIYGDTDSVFIWLEKVDHSEQARQEGERLATYLNRWWQDTLRKVFGVESCLELEFETHYRQFYMPTMRGSEAGSKKRYAGLIETGDGGEKLVFKGLEYVRTDWTPLARRVQYEVCWKVFHQQDPAPYLQQVIAQLFAGELDEELVYRKRIRRKLSDYQRNVPPHVQAARKADERLGAHGKTPRYRRGGWVRYFITRHGAEPEECLASNLDYDHYLTRQIAPAVDGLLHFLGTSTEQIQQSQLSLF